jgi:NAD-dependent deacetylase
MFESVCLSCDDRREMREALARVPAGETGPPCDRCGGILKSATISFGQSLDRAVLDQAQIAARSCDLMLAAGGSLTVLPAAGLGLVAK